MKIPDHWMVVSKEEDLANRFCDDGRDYDKPMYARKDWLARIYHNEFSAGTDYEFAIAWHDGDGDCRGTLEEAIEVADKYLTRNGK
jgi:hypothetical protein